MSNQIEITKNIINYLSSNGYNHDPIIDELVNETNSFGNIAKMQIAPEQGHFIELIVKLLKAKNCLEIGRFTGLSTLCIAKGLPPDGKIVSIDNSNEFLKIAEKYWKKCGLEKKIESVLGEGVNILLSYVDRQKSFDFIFIDADKNNYETYYELSLKLLKQNGLILIDNMLWGGDVAQKTITDKSTESIRKLNSKIMNDSRVEFCLLPIADGISFIRKK